MKEIPHSSRRISLLKTIKSAMLEPALKKIDSSHTGNAPTALANLPCKYF